MVYDIRESDRHSEHVNEIPYEYKNITGRLKDDGTEVSILAMVIAPERDIVVNLVYIGTSADHQRHHDEWEKIYYSIRERR